MDSISFHASSNRFRDNAKPTICKANNMQSQTNEKPTEMVKPKAKGIGK